MKLTLKKSILFVIFISSTAIILPSSEIIEPQAPEASYLPITEYDNSLYTMISHLIAQYVYQKPATKKIPLKTKKKIIKKATRDQALAEIKKSTTKLFDREDPYHISVHLKTMNDLSQHLDKHLDKKTINAIHFLLENQHRSSILLDTLFWKKAIKEHELDTAIPMTPEVASISQVDKLMILNKKMKLPLQIELEPLPA